MSAAGYHGRRKIRARRKRVDLGFGERLGPGLANFPSLSEAIRQARAERGLKRSAPGVRKRGPGGGPKR